ncbi:RHOMBOID-like protein [Drosera capensis]
MQRLITKTRKLLLNPPKTTPFDNIEHEKGQLWRGNMGKRVGFSGCVESVAREEVAVSVDNFKSGRVHTLITSAVSHVDFFHLASNMVDFTSSEPIGRTFGPETLLKLYFARALAGSVFYLVHHAFLAKFLKERRMWDLNPSSVPALGASRAVNAIILLNIFMFPRATLYINFLIPVPAIFLGIYLIGSDVLRIIEGDPQVSGSTHLGGATVALLAGRSSSIRIHSFGRCNSGFISREILKYQDPPIWEVQQCFISMATVSSRTVLTLAAG